MTWAMRPVGKLAERSYLLPTKLLSGLYKVNADLVGFVQSRSPQRQATLDMDACLVETHKPEAHLQLQEVQGIPAADDLLG